jgi:hypothetical protein
MLPVTKSHTVLMSHLSKYQLFRDESKFKNKSPLSRSYIEMEIFHSKKAALFQCSRMAIGPMNKAQKSSNLFLKQIFYFCVGNCIYMSNCLLKGG